jgi:hypothetical protein
MLFVVDTWIGVFLIALILGTVIHGILIKDSHKYLLEVETGAFLVTLIIHFWTLVIILTILSVIAFIGGLIISRQTALFLAGKVLRVPGLIILMPSDVIDYVLIEQSRGKYE